MSRIYIILLTIAATVIAVTGAAFSIFGLAQLFSGAAYSVAFMAGALEFAKLVVTGFLYRYWGHIHGLLRVYLSFAVVTLVGITSVGIFGYLSNAYQKSSFGLRAQQLKIHGLEEDHQRVQTQITDLRRFVDGIPNSRITKRFEFQREYAPQILKLRKQSDKITEEIGQVRFEMLNTQAKIGPIIYLAEALNVSVDTAVKYLILVFVLVFDPLAVCLVFSLNLAIRLREKYRGNEMKISAHSLSNPVDHRYKKGHFFKKTG